MFPRVRINLQLLARGAESSGNKGSLVGALECKRAGTHVLRDQLVVENLARLYLLLLLHSLVKLKLTGVEIHAFNRSLRLQLALSWPMIAIAIIVCLHLAVWVKNGTGAFIVRAYMRRTRLK